VKAKTNDLPQHTAEYRRNKTLNPPHPALYPEGHASLKGAREYSYPAACRRDSIELKKYRKDFYDNFALFILHFT
jgi:hypothetical protein